MWIDFSSKKILTDFYYNSCKENLHWKDSIFSFLKKWYDNESVLKVSTSGTTGSPKTIFLKKKHMFERAIKTVEFLKLTKRGVRGLLCLSPDFIASKMFLVRAIIFKWKVYCVPPSSNPLKNIKEYFDITSMVPMQVFFSLKYLEYVKILLIGGYSVSDFLEKKLQNISTICYETYGMTETLGHIALRKINGSNKSSFYKSFQDIHLSIDERSCLGIFYPCDSFIQTNDIVSMISSDEFTCIGRYDNVINSGGIKIIPELIEKNMNFFIHRRFFISSIPDKILGEKIVLIIEGSPFQFEYPEFFFNGKNKFYKPKNIFFIPHFIENSLGKLRRKEIMKKLIQKIK
ncbi:O-succinylbenzoate-CoA ligase [Blattabacterium sp. (Blattella germanica) str. Bge]|uniref:AMP-binding protein n=1 Tax=Blattabacterium sp. (Blattella germanica) TaxID=624186 RepID=UPI0001BB615A|nr:AMP-binding protein [Blattabacterium sp. (Blattella germanica)]ACY40292.1 O-succinylbenzoate-CoA ligase [Blattabacterium sp. (Blattella germanica) str. Bge]